MLSAKRFAAVQRLQSAASNNPPMKMGESGEAVRVLQLALLSLDFPMSVSTKNYASLPDGIYGQETYQAVKAFQARYGLPQDGIVGRDTLGKLDGLFSSSANPDCQACGNCHKGCGPYAPPASHSSGIRLNGLRRGACATPQFYPPLHDTGRTGLGTNRLRQQP